MHHVGIAPGHVGDGDAIELIAPHATRRPAKVASPVVDGADILVEHQAAARKEAGQVRGIDPESPPLARFTELREEFSRALECLRRLKHEPVNIGEYYGAADGGARTPAQR